MSKAVFIADLHIKLGQKNVPKAWQRERFVLLCSELNAIDCDYVIVGGDLFDVAKPSLEEVGLMFDFFEHLKHEVILIPGNHEMISKTRDCYEHIEHMMGSLNVIVFREFTHYDGIDYIPYNIVHQSEYPEPQSKFAVTHVRGEIPPHVKPEVPLSNFAAYDKVFAGDLHSYSNCQENILYPGSPFYTSFHNKVSPNTNGYFIIDTVTGEHEWKEFKLPQLIKTKVTKQEDMVKTEYHHTIYELEGTLEELSKVKDTELLSKKVTTEYTSEATLNLGGDLGEELAEYLTRIKNYGDSKVATLVSLFKGIRSDSN